jgi:hypothetical protein
MIELSFGEKVTFGTGKFLAFDHFPLMGVE